MDLLFREIFMGIQQSTGSVFDSFKEKSENDPQYKKNNNTATNEFLVVIVKNVFL